MSVRVGAIALLLGAVLAAPAAAQEPPVLTEDPPTQLDGSPTPAPTPTATPSPTATASAGPREELADTGSEPALLALAGLSLLGMGLSLRLAVPDGALG